MNAAEKLSVFVKSYPFGGRLPIAGAALCLVAVVLFGPGPLRLAAVIGAGATVLALFRGTRRRPFWFLIGLATSIALLSLLHACFPKMP
jgi:hypothetical protein